MSLYYAERQELAKALRRFTREESGYDDAKKTLLLSLINNFADWGLHYIKDPYEQKLFQELLQDALE